MPFFRTKCFGHARCLRIAFTPGDAQKRREEAHALQKLRETEATFALFVHQIHRCFLR